MSDTTTLATNVYDALRRDILNGALDPGAKLLIDVLGRRYEVGGSPVREALSRLSSEGLVDRRDQRGFYVSAVDLDQCRELVRTRCMLEIIALRESLQHRTTEWEEALVIAFHRLSQVPRSSDPDSYATNPAWERLHGEFHRALISQCPSHWLLGFCRDLRDHADRYRQIAARHAFFERDEQDEHRAIFEAVVQGRADEASRLLAQHYTTTLSVIEQHGATAFTKIDETRLGR